MDTHHGWYVSFKPLFGGTLLSLSLLLAAYFLVLGRVLDSGALSAIVFALAILQGTIQLIYMMHVGLESKPYWNVMTFFFLLVLCIVVIGGSIWIMNNLDYNVMPDMHMGK